MSNLKPQIFCYVLLIVISCKIQAGASLVQANWEPCKYDNGTVIPTASENVEVYVTNCSRNEAQCNFVRGTTPQLNITFKAKTESREIERGIVAKMFMRALGRNVKIPYGSLINPCDSMRSLNTTNTNCLSSGITKDHLYNSLSAFKVSNDFPSVQNIKVVVILRKKLRNLSRRDNSLRNYENHPGMFVCIELKNCAVV